MYVKRLTLTLVLACLLSFGNPAKILGVFPIPGFSDYSLGVRLLKELAAKGHEVTMLAAFGENESIPNYRAIVMSDYAKDIQDSSKAIDMFARNSQDPFSELLFLNSFGFRMSNSTLSSSHTKKLLESNDKFDAVIIHQFMNDALKGICFHYKVPCITYSALPTSFGINMQVGNPSNPSYIPEMGLRHKGSMNLWLRIKNTLLHYFNALVVIFHTIPQQEKLLHQHFPNAPPLKNLIQNTSLVLLNTHVSTSQAIPLVPNMIEIGGHHIEPPKKLPVDLQTYLDSSKEGVVYFSMGSVLKSKDVPFEKREAILSTFKKLKLNVLWKFEEDLRDKPKNVKIEKWLPQKDILAHPNVKLFISHGGMSGTTEAIYLGVPIVGLPIYGDQMNNILEAAQAGFALPLKYADLNEESFTNAINEVLNNDKYRENAKLRSRIMRDRPMSPSETAIFWIEYVINHKGAPHLRSSALNLTWYQYHLLDVLTIISMTLTIGLVSIIALIGKCCGFNCCLFSLIKRSKCNTNVSKKNE